MRGAQLAKADKEIQLITQRREDIERETLAFLSEFYTTYSFDLNECALAANHRIPEDLSFSKRAKSEKSDFTRSAGFLYLKGIFLLPSLPSEHLLTTPGIVFEKLEEKKEIRKENYYLMHKRIYCLLNIISDGFYLGVKGADESTKMLWQLFKDGKIQKNIKKACPDISSYLCGEEFDFIEFVKNFKDSPKNPLSHFAEETDVNPEISSDFNVRMRLNSSCAVDMGSSGLFTLNQNPDRRETIISLSQPHRPKTTHNPNRERISSELIIKFCEDEIKKISEERKKSEEHEKAQQQHDEEKQQNKVEMKKKPKNCSSHDPNRNVPINFPTFFSRSTSSQQLSPEGNSTPINATSSQQLSSERNSLSPSPINSSTPINAPTDEFDPFSITSQLSPSPSPSPIQRPHTRTPAMRNPSLMPVIRNSKKSSSIESSFLNKSPLQPLPAIK